MNLESIWDSVAKRIANTVNANIGSQLADSAKSIHSVRSLPRAAVYPKSQVRQSAGGYDDPMLEIRGMFQKILEKTQTAGKSGIASQFLRMFTQPNAKQSPERAVPSRQTIKIEQPKPVTQPNAKQSPERAVPSRQTIKIEQPKLRQPFWTSIQKSPVVPKEQKPEQPIQPQRSLKERTEEKLGAFFHQFDRYSAKFFNKLGFGKIAHDPDDDQRQPSPQTSEQSSPRSNWMRMFGQQVQQPNEPARNQTQPIQFDDLRQTHQTAIAKRDQLGSKIGTTEYNEKEHRSAIKEAASAESKLHEATKLDAKATLTNASASGRVAEALRGLGPIIGRLGWIGLAVSAAGAAVRAPWSLMHMGTSRLDYLEKQGEYQGHGAALGAARYAQTSGNIEALNARDTAKSTVFMVDQLNELRQNLRPVGAGYTNLTNYAMGGGMMLMNNLATTVNDVANVMQANMNAIKEHGFFGATKENVDKELEKLTDEQLKKAEEDKKKFSEIGTQTAKSAVVEMKRKMEARLNNKPRRPLKPL